VRGRSSGEVQARGVRSGGGNGGGGGVRRGWAMAALWRGVALRGLRARDEGGSAALSFEGAASRANSPPCLAAA
jgi:hypothetical protein